MIRQAPDAPYQSVAFPSSIVRWNTRFADASALVFVPRREVRVLVDERNRSIGAIVHRVLRVGPGEGVARRGERNRRGDEEASHNLHLPL